MRVPGLISLFFLVVTCLPAQTLWELGLQGGMSAYSGDLNPNEFFDLEMSSPMYGIWLRRNLHPNIAFRLNILGGTVTGDERHFDSPAWRTQRGFRFETEIWEPGIFLEYDILAHRRTREMKFRKIISPYVFGGPAYLIYTPNTNYNDLEEPNALISSERISEDRQSNKTQTQLSWVFGGGLKFDLGRKIQLGLEIGIRQAQTDRLDGVMVTGNPSKPDWYGVGSISLVRRLYQPDSDRDFIPNKHDKCPLLAGPRRMKGCPDIDFDGITDLEDDCPEVAGVPSANGCPDFDRDGVQDSLDICPGVPGSIKAFGCPDTDGDGFRNSVDLCPDIPGLASQGGCPDRDGDGIRDQIDQCPDQGGVVTPEGCPDLDGDGIVDSLDTCPELAGIEKFGGCPDTDEDGIEDREDECPEKMGTAYFCGCPDTDKDGIEDKEDECPTEPGLFRFYGCPDSDGDGIEDRKDMCPELAGTSKGSGCPVISVKDKKELKLTVKQVQFETGSDQLTEKSLVVLEKAVEILNKYPNYHIRIHGHTDSVGKASSNKKLSERRAASCMNYLIDKGVDKTRLQSKGFGESKPIASNRSRSGRAKNRRVEFVLDEK